MSQLDARALTMSSKPVTVADLIEHLQTLPQHMPVVYCQYSEYVLLELRDLEITELQAPRPDGWVHSRRADREAVPYLVLPGN